MNPTTWICAFNLAQIHVARLKAGLFCLKILNSRLINLTGIYA